MRIERKSMGMKKYIFYFTLLVWMSAGADDIRIWTDKKGRKYEAAFVSEMFDKVTLRDAQGKETRLAVDDLSENDQLYMRVMIPPELEIKFSKKVQPKPRPWELYDSDHDTTFLIDATVEISKKSKRPFTSRLTAELFLIAKQYEGDNYILLSKTDSSFLLNDDNDNKQIIKAGTVEVSVFTEYNDQRRGWEYQGYLVAVSDARGNILQVVTDIEWLRDKVPNLREIYVRGQSSMYSRFFDKQNVQKVRAPRPVYYMPRQK